MMTLKLANLFLILPIILVAFIGCGRIENMTTDVTPMKPVVEELPEEPLVSSRVCQVGDVLRPGEFCYLISDDSDDFFFGNNFFEFGSHGAEFLSLLGTSSITVEHFDAESDSVHKFIAIKQDDGSWRIDSVFPSDNIGCQAGDVMRPGHSCVLLIEGRFTVLGNGSAAYHSYHDSHINILGVVDFKTIDFSAEKQDEGTWRVTDE